MSSTDTDADNFEEIIEDGEDEFVRAIPTTPTLKVKKTTNPKRLAKTIMGCIKDFGYCELDCVLQASYWQAGKAYILARAELVKIDLDITRTEGFIEPRPVIDGEPKTGIKITIRPVAVG